MAHHKRKRAAIAGTKRYSGHGLSKRLAARGVSEDDVRHYDGTPRWWNKLHHVRPARTERRRLVAVALRDPDGETLWPLARKPHKYYW